ncbi:putative acyl-CoA dehydrogenase, precursor [Trypanosoma vivax]|nr:putative acyl-CoA dehydrogenase, precursor [Trypanosoma vivax]
MRRLVTFWGQAPARHSSSYAAGLFHYKIVPAEMFPYPCRKFSIEEEENLRLVLEELRSNSVSTGNLFGARIAVEYGGLGLSNTAHALINEELGAGCCESMLSALQHSGVCTSLLSTVGSRELKGKYLTSMSDGTIKMGWAIEEPFIGGDISMISAESTLSQEGGYTLTGKKHCFGAAEATHFLVLAKAITQASTEEGAVVSRRGTLFICSREAAGLKVEEDCITLESTPVSDIVGVVGEGFKNVMIALFTEQHLYSALLLGIVKRVSRILHKLPGEQKIYAAFSSIDSTLYAMESVLYALTATMDVPAEDSLLECALTSAFVQQAAAELLGELEALVSLDRDIGDCLLRARNIFSHLRPCGFFYVTAACCGIEDYGLLFQKASTLEIMQARLIRAIGFYDRVPVKNCRDAGLIDEAVVKFGSAVETAFVRNGSHVPYQQMLLNRLGEAASLLYVASAVASRVSMCHTKGLDTAKDEELLGAGFIRYAVDKAKVLCEQTCNLGKTTDDVCKRVALHICEDILR